MRYGWRGGVVCLLLFAACIVAGCGRAGKPDPSSSAALVVIAPYGVEGALKEIHARFLERHPGAKLDLRLGMVDDLTTRVGSGQLTGDVYIAADGPELQLATESGAVDAKRRRIWTRCPVVIAVPKTNPKHVFELRGTLRADITKIALPDPERDSTGQIFAAALREAGYWEQVKPKLTYVASPYAACEQVEKQAADCAVTYAPSVTTGPSAGKLSLATLLPRDTPLAAIAAAPFTNSRHPLLAAYLEFLGSPEAQVAVGRAGFEPVTRPSPGEAEHALDVPCGAGLQPAMDDLGRLYLDRTGVRVDFSYAGAGMLLSQLLTTHRGDLYIPGEAFYVDQARKHDLIAEDTPMCYMTPVIGVRKGNPAHVTGLADMGRSGLRIALGDPQAIAIGPMSERILKRAGVFDAVERNVSMKAACVPELANALATHSADAGIIWDVMAVQNAKSVDALPIDPAYNEVSEVLVSRLSCSKQPEEARKLMAFLTSEEAAAVFRQHGYATVRPAGVRLAPRAKVGGK